MGILAQTGKYRPGQMHLLEPPTLISENLKAAVDLLLNRTTARLP
jgi:hypothetical protein